MPIAVWICAQICINTNEMFCILLFFTNDAFELTIGNVIDYQNELPLINKLYHWIVGISIILYEAYLMDWEIADFLNSLLTFFGQIGINNYLIIKNKFRIVFDHDIFSVGFTNSINWKKNWIDFIQQILRWTSSPRPS